MEESKEQLFDKELKVLEHAKSILEQINQADADWKAEYKTLTDDFEKLLEDSKVITKISDRLQNRLNLTNDKLKEANDTLEANSKEIAEKNEELRAINDEIEQKNVLLQNTNQILQSTIDELTKARISRRAAMLVLVAAIVLFVISEAFIEPFVDAYFLQNWWLIGFVIKCSIALLLKPIDYFLEGYLLRLASKNKKTLRTLQAQPEAS
jgi:uncharacterized membrane protein